MKTENQLSPDDRVLVKLDSIQQEYDQPERIYCPDLDCEHSQALLADSQNVEKGFVCGRSFNFEWQPGLMAKHDKGKTSCRVPAIINKSRYAPDEVSLMRVPSFFRHYGVDAVWSKQHEQNIRQ